MATKNGKPDTTTQILEEFQARLTGTRRRARSTVITYTQTVKHFLASVKNPRAFSPEDVSRYIARRRSAGISERTLLKEFFHLKKLAQILQVPWPFTRDDSPFPREKAKTPVLNPEYIEKMILTQDKLSKGERFYLAVATIFACRREAMSQIKKRDYDESALLIHGVHGGETIRHLIPEALRPIIANYRAKEASVRALSFIFTRIVRKSGLNLEKGHGWHSMRRALTSVMRYVLPASGVEASLWAEFTGWSRISEGETFFGSGMMGHYTHPEILQSEFMQKLKVLTGETHGNDPYWLDTTIYLVHPFLRIWEKALAPKPAVKPSSVAKKH